jgi:hypothetical protein
MHPAELGPVVHRQASHAPGFSANASRDESLHSPMPAGRSERCRASRVRPPGHHEREPTMEVGSSRRPGLAGMGSAFLTCR